MCTSLLTPSRDQLSLVSDPLQSCPQVLNGASRTLPSGQFLSSHTLWDHPPPLWGFHFLMTPRPSSGINQPLSRFTQATRQLSISICSYLLSWFNIKGPQDSTIEGLVPRQPCSERRPREVTKWTIRTQGLARGSTICRVDLAPGCFPLHFLKALRYTDWFHHSLLPWRSTFLH